MHGELFPLLVKRILFQSCRHSGSMLHWISSLELLKVLPWNQNLGKEIGKLRKFHESVYISQEFRAISHLTGKMFISSFYAVGNSNLPLCKESPASMYIMRALDSRYVWVGVTFITKMQKSSPSCRHKFYIYRVHLTSYAYFQNDNLYSTAALHTVISSHRQIVK